MVGDEKNTNGVKDGNGPVCECCVYVLVCDKAVK